MAIQKVEHGGKRVKKEKLDKIKRPASAYNVFVKENSQSMRDSGKYLGQKEVCAAYTYPAAVYMQHDGLNDVDCDARMM